MILDKLFGSAAAERVLLYIANYGDGYAAGIARTFGMSSSQVQKQLDKFEQSGILVQRAQGRMRLYTWNPRWPLRPELEALLESALSKVTVDEEEQFFLERRRPRIKGKKYELVSKRD